MTSRAHRVGRRALALAFVLAAAWPAAALAAPRLLSGFFGLDNSANPGLTLLCGRGVHDGLPVTTSSPVTRSTLAASDFTLTTRSGASRRPRCATLFPADERGERRTILLVGSLGDDPADPPVSVTVTGSLQTGEGDLLGQAVNVTPLAAGPSMVAAERLAGSTGRTLLSPGCPVLETAQTARVLWDGGITRVHRRPTRTSDARRYVVTYADGTAETPFSLGDLNDFDNYHELCLTQRKAIAAVTVQAGFWVDPRGDANTANLTLSQNITG